MGADVADQKGVAVWLRLLDDTGRNLAASSGTVFDDDWMANILRYL